MTRLPTFEKPKNYSANERYGMNRLPVAVSNGQGTHVTSPLVRFHYDPFVTLFLTSQAVKFFLSLAVMLHSNGVGVTLVAFS
jgi:hypothetical protein